MVFNLNQRIYYLKNGQVESGVPKYIKMNGGDGFDDLVYDAVFDTKEEAIEHLIQSKLNHIKQLETEIRHLNLNKNL